MSSHQRHSRPQARQVRATEFLNDRFAVPLAHYLLLVIVTFCSASYAQLPRALAPDLDKRMARLAYWVDGSSGHGPGYGSPRWARARTGEPIFEEARARARSSTLCFGRQASAEGSRRDELREYAKFENHDAPQFRLKSLDAFGSAIDGLLEC